VRKFQVVCLLTLVCNIALAANSFEKVNNQASIHLAYLPTHIQQAPAVDNANYLQGHQLNLSAVFTKTFYQHIYSQIALSSSAGNLSYGKNTFRTSATTFLQELNLRIGYSFFPAEKLALTPYFSGGYQYWQLDTGGRPIPNGIIDGATKFYQNGTAGLGLLTQFVITPKLIVNLDGMLGRTINPWMRFNASNVPNTLIGTSIIYQQAHLLPQLLYQLGVSTDYLITEKIHAIAGLQYKHTEYSSVVTTPSQLKQPHLSASTWAYSLGAGYNFDSNPSSSPSYHYDAIPAAIYAVNNQAALLFGYVSQHYAETLPGLGHYFDRQVGNIPFVVMLLNKTIDRLYAQFSLSSGGGNTAYKGGIIGSSSAVSNTSTRNTLFDVALKLGFMLPFNNKIVLTPYVAGGFHRWLRDIAGVNDSGFLVSGYPETYQHAWYALGVLLQYTPHPNWVLSLDGNAGTIQNAQNRNWSSLVGNGARTVQQVYSLKQRFAFNLGINSDYRFLQNWHALLQMNYWYFKYGLSAATYFGTYEPNSTTRQLSFLVGLGYEFD